MCCKPEGETVRAFVAVKVAAEAAAELIQLQQDLARQIPQRTIRWCRPEQLHLTLRFLGNVDLTQVPRVEAAVREVCCATGPFRLRLSAPGAFPRPARPRVLWVGLDGDLDPLRRLQVRVEEACAGLGTHQETREFHPHLTLGRVAKGAERQSAAVAAALDSTTSTPPSEWSVEEIFLIRSRLGAQGATYEDLATFPLLGK